MKYKILIIMISVICVTDSIYAQKLALQWVNHFGNIGWDYISDLKPSDEGSFYLAGCYKGTLPGDTSHPWLSSSNNAWLSKCDTKGSIIWQKVFGGKLFDNATSIVSLSQGVLVSGLFQDTLYIDSLQITCESFSNAYIAKVNNNGKIEQLNKYGGKALISNILVSASPTLASIYVAGSFKDSLQIADTILFHTNGEGIFISRLSDDGDLNVPISLECSGPIELGGMVCSDSMVIIAGSYCDTLYLADSIIVSSGGIDTFILAYNLTGKFEWIKLLSGDGNIQSASIALSDNEDIGIAGTFENTMFLDQKIVTSHGNMDSFIALLSSTGMVKWIKCIGSISNDYGHSVSFNSDNDLFLSGSFNHSITLPEESGNYIQLNSYSVFGNAFIAKYSNEGILKASFNIPGTSEDFCNNILINDGVVTASGNFYKELNVTDSIGIMHEIESNGEKDIFLIQFSDICKDFLVDAGDDTLVCLGQSIYLCPHDPYYSWQWAPDGQLNQNITVSDTGVYLLIAVNEFGCIDYDSIYVGTYSVPFAFAGNDTIIQPGYAFETTQAYIQNADGLSWETSGNGYFFNENVLNTGYSLSYDDISKGEVFLTLNASNNCTTFSDSLKLSLPIQEDGITVYPNPTNGPVTFVCEENMSILSVSITNQTGTIIESEITTNNIMFNYDLLAYPPGTFLFHLTTSNGVITKVVNKL